jgi:hypothetical protein
MGRMARWLVLCTASLSLAWLIAGCAPVLGIDEAHVDPTFGVSSSQDGGAPDARRADAAAPDGGNCGSPDTPPSTFSCPICKPFDNAKRLTNLLPDGGLAPLPDAQ